MNVKIEKIKYEKMFKNILTSSFLDFINKHNEIYNFIKKININNKRLIFKYYYNYNLIYMKFNYLYKINNKYQLKNILKTNNYYNFNILLYKPLSTRYLDNYEYIYKYKLLCGNKKNILEITNYPEFLESCYKFEKKYKKTISNYNLLYVSKYKYIDKEINIMNLLKFYNNINIKQYDEYFTKKFILNNIKKYDIIMSGLSTFFTTDILFEYQNIQLFFNLLFYSLLRLNKDGTFIYKVKSINLKATADLILIGKKYFKEIIIHNIKLIESTTHNTNLIVIFKNFKGIQSKDIKQFTNIFNKLYKNDKTSLNLNSNNKKINKNKQPYIQKFLTHKNNPINKYPSSFLDIPLSSPKYDFIRDINNNMYYTKIIGINKIIENVKLYGDNIPPKHIRERQLINSYLYAKEFDLETIPFDEGTFSSNFGKLIMNDMYCLHKPIIIEFDNRKNKLYKDKFKNISNNDNTNLISVCDELNKISKLFHIVMSAIDSRNIKNWNSEKKKSRYYDKGIYEHDKLKTLVSTKYNNGFELSQAWLKMYEICTLFNIISKKKKLLIQCIYVNYLVILLLQLIII